MLTDCCNFLLDWTWLKFNAPSLRKRERQTNPAFVPFWTFFYCWLVIHFLRYLSFLFFTLLSLAFFYPKESFSFCYLCKLMTALTHKLCLRAMYTGFSFLLQEESMSPRKLPLKSDKPAIDMQKKRCRSCPLLLQIAIFCKLVTNFLQVIFLQPDLQPLCKWPFSFTRHRNGFWGFKKWLSEAFFSFFPNWIFRFWVI